MLVILYVSTCYCHILQDSKKIRDLETQIPGPGKKRDLYALGEGGGGDSYEGEGQAVDLKVAITEREKQGVKSDPYFSFKICTNVSKMLLIHMSVYF